MLNLDYPHLLDLFREHLDPKRTESASFLIWYLENYYRLDSLEAVDSVCDQRGDKGIDGIYLNENENSIDIFQSRISQSSKTTIGDTGLKEFFGTLQQFQDKDTLANLISSAGDADVVRIIKRLDLINKLQTYNVRGIFISNIDPDGNADAYLKTNPNIEVFGKTKLRETYISDERTRPVSTPVQFDISGFPVSEYIIDAQTRALIAPVKARELVLLKGIGDQSLFAFNVRGPLGNTQVNKDIVNSIKNAGTHKLFPLFHNGITIICRKLVNSKEKIKIEGYYVVNGCQSLVALYDNTRHLTDDLRVLCKFIQMDVESELSKRVTIYSNNQNGVKARDFKSNSPTQIRLQNEFDRNYGKSFFYEIKRGETAENVEIISNEMAGLYLMAFDLKEPWGTHRKYRVFDEMHADLFGRPEVTADRIILCHIIMKAIENATAKINNKLFGKYALTKYAFLYMIRTILENDLMGKELVLNPIDFVRQDAKRNKFKECIAKIIDDVIIDVNAEVDEIGETFDYRGKLRDADWVKELTKKVVSNYLKLVQRKRIDSFGVEWASKQ